MKSYDNKHNNFITTTLASLTLAASLFLTSCAGSGGGSGGQSYVSNPAPTTSQTNTQTNSISRLEERIKKSPPIKNYSSDKYAVILSGGTEPEERFRVNVNSSLKILKELGFKEENIYVLDNVLAAETSQYCYTADDLLSEERCGRIFGYLSEKGDNNDLLFVQTIGHGDYIPSQDGTEVSILYVPSQSAITQIDLSNRLKYFDGKIVCLTDQCNSGGFANQIIKDRAVFGKPAVAVASSPQTELSNNYGGLSLTSFFMTAYKTDFKEFSDLNKDGRVSVSEALNFAIREWPQVLTVQKPYIKYTDLLNPDETFLGD